MRRGGGVEGGGGHGRSGAAGHGRARLGWHGRRGTTTTTTEDHDGSDDEEQRPGEGTARRGRDPDRAGEDLRGQRRARVARSHGVAGVARAPGSAAPPVHLERRRGGGAPPRRGG